MVLVINEDFMPLEIGMPMTVAVHVVIRGRHAVTSEDVAEACTAPPIVRVPMVARRRVAAAQVWHHRSEGRAAR